LVGSMTTKYHTHTDAQGRVWHPFTLRYKADGMNFCITVYALSGEHAEYILEDIKATGEIL